MIIKMNKNLILFNNDRKVTKESQEFFD